MTTVRLLLIEDDIDVATNIWEYFEAAGEIVDHAADGLTGLHLAASNSYDVLVLDLGLPGIDGLALAKHLRGVGESRVPIIMLTARDTLDAKLDGFSAGADDYLVKPFALAELSARAHAVIARATGGYASRALRVGDLRFDAGSLHTERGGQEVILTRSGYVILEHLMSNTHRVVRRVELERLLWGEDSPRSDALRSHIHAVRKAIDHPHSTPLIHTISGIGYRLCEKNDLHR